MQIEVEGKANNNQKEEVPGLVFPGDRITDQDVYMK